MMSCAASHAISTMPSFFFERHWAAASTSSICEMYMFNTGLCCSAAMALTRGQGFESHRGYPLWRYTHSLYFNLDQVSSLRLYKRSCNVRSDSRGNGSWGASGNEQKDRKWHRQSGLSTLSVGRGSVRHAICVFMLPIILFHKSLLVISPPDRVFSVIKRRLVASQLWAQPVNHIMVICFVKNYIWLLQKLFVSAKQSRLSMFEKHLIWLISSLQLKQHLGHE